MAASHSLSPPLFVLALQLCTLSSYVANPHAPRATFLHTRGGGGGGGGGGCNSPTQKPPSIFTEDELVENDLAWNAISNHCVGCWSGSMDVYSVLCRNQLCSSRDDDVDSQKKLVPIPSTGGLNFRLRVELDDDDQSGTWTVWNLQREGDETIVPLLRHPALKPSQLKFGFHCGVVVGEEEIGKHGGCILRIPKSWPDSECVVFEIGFWDKNGDGMRRTAVLEYARTEAPKSLPLVGVPEKRNGGPATLAEVSVVQMRTLPSQGFMGNVTDESDVSVLPKVASFDMNDLALEKLKPVKTETVDCRTMRRTAVAYPSGNGLREVRDLVMEALEKRGGFVGHVSTVLPNGLCVSVPHELSLATIDYDIEVSYPIRCIFLHHWQSGQFQAVEVEYDAHTGKALRVHMHSFRYE